MKRYLEDKNRIQIYQDVFETVKTIEKISASKLHFLKQRVKSLSVYTETLEKILIRLLCFHRPNHPFLEKSREGKKALLVITGQKGLVGGLYHTLVNYALSIPLKNCHLMVVGSKGKKYFKEEKIKISQTFLDFSELPDFEEVDFITKYIFEKFLRGEFSRVDILYSHFVSVIEQRPLIVGFLPFSSELIERDKTTSQDIFGMPIFDPSPQEVFNQLLKKYIQIFLYRIVLEAKLSEFSARTVNTENARVKIEKIIKNLKLAYFKERRRDISQKQIESFLVHKLTS